MESSMGLRSVCINNNFALQEKCKQQGVVAVIPNNARQCPVFVTPVRQHSQQQKTATTLKVLLKVVSRAGKNHKMFTLRNIDPKMSCDQVKGIIRAQLKKDVIAGDFDIGYINGSNMICIRSQADLAEVWSEVLAGKSLTLWCDGLRESETTTVRGKQKRSLLSTQDENTSDDQPRPKKKKASEDREEQVQSTIESLKEKHGSSFTPMQVRIWSEMVVGGLHSSMEEPPTSSMFLRAGKGSSSKKKDDNNSLSEAFTQAAVAISSALSPRGGQVHAMSGTSPAKLIEARSKCYKQLHDLCALKESGVFSQDQYEDEKEAVLGTLKKLKSD